DPDQAPRRSASVPPPPNGALTGPAPRVTSAPTPGFSVSLHDALPIYDGRGGVDQAIVSITVGEAPNQTPTANPQSLSTPHQTPLASTSAGSAPDQDPLTIAIVTRPSNGALSGTAPSVTYTPSPGFSGS